MSFLIDKRPRDLECRSPIDGGLLGCVILADSDDYVQVVAASVAGYHEWMRLLAPKRGEIVADLGVECGGDAWKATPVS